MEQHLCQELVRHLEGVRKIIKTILIAYNKMRKQNLLTFFLLLALNFLFSCEAPKLFSVTVIDKKSQKPIDSVRVTIRAEAGGKEQTAYHRQGYTDSLGRFKLSQMIGYGLSVKRWIFYMDYEKKGYIPKTEQDITEGIVELER
jgi:hypothetical protein